jgi:hypothetical protein
MFQPKVSDLKKIKEGMAMSLKHKLEDDTNESEIHKEIKEVSHHQVYS